MSFGRLAVTIEESFVFDCYMIDDALINYIESPSRNKIILSNHEIKDIKYIDLGVLLSEALSTIPFHAIPYELDGILNSIFRTNFKESYVFGRYYAIKNINILFEPELSINFLSLIDKYSKDIPLFVATKGIVNGTIFYPFALNRSYQFDLNNLSPYIC